MNVPTIGVDRRNISGSSSRSTRFELIVRSAVIQRVEKYAKQNARHTKRSSPQEGLKRQRVVDIAVKGSEKDGSGQNKVLHDAHTLEVQREMTPSLVLIRLE